MIEMTPTAFRLMVIASFVASALGLGLDIALSPPAEAEPPACDMVAKCLASLAGLLVIVLSYIAAVIGLLWFRWWARPLYLWGTCLLMVGSALIGSSQVAGPIAALYELLTLLDGAIIAAAYWSSVSGRFDRRQISNDPNPAQNFEATR